jgi:hypothetical protein
VNGTTVLVVFEMANDPPSREGLFSFTFGQQAVVELGILIFVGPLPTD